MGRRSASRTACVNDAMVDLGSALNLALASGEEFAGAVLEGSVHLAAVQNGHWADDLWARVQATAKELDLSRR